jgi:hypothetical protein
MSDPEKLSKILDLCIDIDETAVGIYGSLSDYAGNEALKSFWDKMVVEGQAHLDYWQQLKALPELDELPSAFDDPDSVTHQLEERVGQVQSLKE